MWVDDTEEGGLVGVAADFESYYDEWLDTSIVECAARGANRSRRRPTRTRTSSAPSPSRREAVVGYPTSVKLHDELGMLLLYGVRPREAIAVLERGGKLEDGLVPTSITLALAHRLMKKHEEAIAIVDRALATNPTYFPHREALLWAKARNLAELGRAGEAVDAAHEAVTTGGYFVMRNQMDFFILAVQAGDRARADAALEEFIEQSRNESSLAERRRQVYEIVVEAMTAYGIEDVAEDYKRKIATTLN